MSDAARDARAATSAESQIVMETKRLKEQLPECQCVTYAVI